MYPLKILYDTIATTNIFYMPKRKNKKKIFQAAQELRGSVMGNPFFSTLKYG